MRGAEDRKHFTIRASNGKLQDPNQVIFPIFRQSNDGLLHFLATGFFITKLGWFVTAKHVAEDVLDANGNPGAGLCIVQFREGNIFHVRPVSGFVTHKLADVAIGVCVPMSHKVTDEPLYNKVLTLDPVQLNQGCPVWTYAYPGTTVVHAEKQNINIAPNFYVGKVAEYYPAGRDRSMLPAPCYRTSITLHAASSGGPVFGPGGGVVGVNSSSISGAEHVSFISRIIDIYPMGIPDVAISEGDEPKTVTIQDLIKINHVAVRK